MSFIYFSHFLLLEENKIRHFFGDPGNERRESFLPSLTNHAAHHSLPSIKLTENPPYLITAALKLPGWHGLSAGCKAPARRPGAADRQPLAADTCAILAASTTNQNWVAMATASGRRRKCSDSFNKDMVPGASPGRDDI